MRVHFHDTASGLKRSFMVIEQTPMSEYGTVVIKYRDKLGCKRSVVFPAWYVEAQHTGRLVYYDVCVSLDQYTNRRQ